MTDPTDEDALTWDGDEDRAAPRRPAPRLIDDRPSADGEPAAGGPFALLVLGVLGGVAVLETVFWVRSVFELSIAASLELDGGTPLEVGAFALNVLGRVLAVIAPVVWFGLVAWRVRVPSRRVAMLVLGALLLVPWPAILAAAP